jgi:hypothetical protein
LKGKHGFRTKEEKKSNSGSLLELSVERTKELPLKDTPTQSQKPTDVEEVLINSISVFTEEGGFL